MKAGDGVCRHAGVGCLGGEGMRCFFSVVSVILVVSPDADCGSQKGGAAGRVFR